MLRRCEGNQDFSDIDFKFATALDQNKCLNHPELKQLKLPAHLYLSYQLT